MRLRRKKKIQDLHELNMPAMIDIVMLLLIFFMCTSNLAQPENRMHAALSQLQEGAGSQQLMDNVEIELAGSDDSLVILCDGTPCADWDDLRSSLKLRREIADLDVIVRGDAEVPFEDMVKAVDISHVTGFTNVAFSAKGPAQ